VVESSNNANSIIFYGKSGDISTNRREEMEMAVLCLRILQAALVYVNTLMLQAVLADPAWARLLTPTFLRALGAAKLIEPLRSGGGHRRCSRYQLRLAARARELVDQGTPVEAACRIIIILEDQLAEALRINQAREHPAAH
jgi:hypothetical protein